MLLKKKAFLSIESFLFLKPDSGRWICLFLGTCQLANKRSKSNSGQTLWSSENKSRHFLSCQRCFHHPTIFSIEDKLTPILNKRWREEQKETATLSKDIIWVHFHLKCEEYRSSLRSFHLRHNLSKKFFSNGNSYEDDDGRNYYYKEFDVNGNYNGNDGKPLLLRLACFLASPRQSQQVLHQWPC